MTRPRRLLTVCLGNYCRSPIAALILAQRGGPAVAVRSAGIRDRWVGHPAHPMMLAAAAERGYDLTEHRGTHLTPELLHWADVVLAMDGDNLTALHRLTDDRTPPRCALYLKDRDVPDPFGKGPGAFADVVALIEKGAAVHLP